MSNTAHTLIPDSDSASESLPSPDSASEGAREALIMPTESATAEEISDTVSSALERLLVLSRDERLLETLRAVTAEHGLSVVDAEAELAERLLRDQAGVAILDAAVMGAAIPELSERLRRQFPELVLIVAGNAEDQVALSSQLAQGVVYRFLHKPVSEQRVRLFIESARKRHDAEHAKATTTTHRALPATSTSADATAQSSAGGFKLSSPAIWSAGGVVLALTLGLVLWLGMRSPAPPPQPAPVAATPIVRSPADIAAEAQAAAEAEFEKHLGDAETALLAERLEEATQATAAAAAVHPEHPRVAFLTLQIDKEKARLALAKDAGQSREQLAQLRRELDRARQAAQSKRAPETRAASAPANGSAERGTSGADGAADKPSVNNTLIAAAAPSATAGTGASGEATTAEAGQTDTVAADAGPERVSAATLERTRYVAPRYPQSALERGVSGWVDLEFTVTRDGKVQDITIARAEPAGVFDTAATDAVRRWRYKPAERNNASVDIRTRQRIRFKAP